jgi:GTP-binding protein Era
MITLVKASAKPVVVILSKTDLVQYQRRIEILKRKLAEVKTIKHVFEMSQNWGKDLKPLVAEIENLLLTLLPETPQPLYDIELFTPHTQRELVEEIVREKCFLELDMEVPYNLAVQVLNFREEGMVNIACQILVAKETHKAIVIGQKAVTIKRIGILARKEIEKMIGAKVYLQLEVKCKENWMQNTRTMKELGYVVESKS